jgi:hypothetical protein
MRAWSLAWVVMVGAERPAAVPERPARLPGVADRMHWPADFWSSAVRAAPHGPEEAAISAIIEQVRSVIFHHHGL